MIPRALLRRLMAAEFARSARIAVRCQANAFRAARAIRRSAAIMAGLDNAATRMGARD
jgi:hypothetical protein